MPTPQEAAAILSKFITPTRYGQVVGGGGSMDASDVLELNDLRGRRRDELALAQPGTTKPHALEEVNADIDDDPDTGVRQQQRVAATIDADDAASRTLMPRVDDAAKAVASRNAFGAFLGKEAGYRADTSPAGTKALDAASRRKVDEGNATAGGKLDNALALLDAKGINPSAAAKSSITALNDVQFLAPQVLQRLREKHPGIEKDPAQYGGMMDTAVEKAKRFAYGVGMYTPDEDIGQLTQLLRVIAARPYMNGRPNQRVYDDIVSHLGEFGFSPGADYARIQKILELEPELREGITAAEQPLPRLTSASSAAGRGAPPAPGGGRLPAGITVTRVK